MGWFRRASERWDRVRSGAEDAEFWTTLLFGHGVTFRIALAITLALFVAVGLAVWLVLRLVGVLD